MKNIFITGFMGVGKTSVGQAVARQLGWAYVDTDDVLERIAGKSIEAVFAEDGEDAFRALESRALAEVCGGERQVIATGGGMVKSAANREIMRTSGFVVCLEATPETIVQRLYPDGAGQGAVRPLLAGPNGETPLERARTLKAERAAAYSDAHWTVHTDALTVADAAQEALRAARAVGGVDNGPSPDEPDLAAVVRSSAHSCPIFAGTGVFDRLGELCRSVGLTTTAYLISDSNVFYSHGRRAQVALESADIPVHTFVVPAGENSKRLETLELVYTWLAEQRAERGHFVVGLGGGVVGDLAGYAAATFNRGLPLVQAPTSLAAMVDASIGGKTAVNLEAGKNLVGAFHQPRLVVAEVDALQSLPERELASGWAEAIKHGLILDEELFQTFEDHAEAISRLERPLADDVVRRSMAVKADVVSKDERETLGLRILLNYGHTIGHALEAATQYGELLHGEAGAIGMTAAVRISRSMGLIGDDLVSRQDALLRRFNLPTSLPGADRDAVRAAMSVDKKTAAGSIRWVLLDGVGSSLTRNDVPAEIVEEALAAVT